MNVYEQIQQIQQIIQKLRSRIPLPSLVPEKIWDKDLSQEIGTLSVNPTMAATLFLWNDDLEKAHSLAQQVESSTGSLIHGIMHRRQPDYSNSKYWFRQAGSHPIFINLIQEFPNWEPLSFVDQCEQASKKNDLKAIEDLSLVQSREFELLAHYCLELENLP